jgi:hypothetical protein
LKVRLLFKFLPSPHLLHAHRRLEIDPPSANWFEDRHQAVVGLNTGLRHPERQHVIVRLTPSLFPLIQQLRQHEADISSPGSYLQPLGTAPRLTRHIEGASRGVTPVGDASGPSHVLPPQRRALTAQYSTTSKEMSMPSPLVKYVDVKRVALTDSSKSLLARECTCTLRRLTRPSLTPMMQTNRSLKFLDPAVVAASKARE